MKNSTKNAIIIALILVVAGMVISALGFAMMNFHFNLNGDGNMNYTTKTYKITEDFSSISIDISVSDIALRVSEDGESRVEFYENDKRTHTAEVRDGVLCIGEQKHSSVLNLFSYDLSKPRVTLYLAPTEFDSLHINSDTSLIVVPAEFSFRAANITNHTGDVSYSAPTATRLSVKVTTGRIMVSEISVSEDIMLQADTGHVTLTEARAGGNVFVRTTTGRIHLENIECQRLDAVSSSGAKNISDVKCKDFSSESNTGKVTLDRVIADGELDIETSTGDVLFENCDGGEIDIDTDTGDVRGSLLTEKVIFAETDTGRISVPHSTKGGKCEIKTDTGNITITIVQ